MSDQLDQMYLHTTQLLCLLWRKDLRKILCVCVCVCVLNIRLGREFLCLWMANKKCY